MASANAIYLARHGESTWNAERRWTGQADPPLTDLGRAQAKEACRAFRTERFDAVASSGLVRAIETASILGAELGLPRLDPMSDLNERFAGELSGLTVAEISERWPDFVGAWRAGELVDIPGGEPWDAFVDRAMRGLGALRASPGRVLVVAHMGVQRAIEHGFGKPVGSYANLEGFWVRDA